MKKYIPKPGVPNPTPPPGAKKGDGVVRIPELRIPELRRGPVKPKPIPKPKPKKGK